ncbi:MAG: hypothetical protein MUC74_11545 [Ideonella sp.]|jgi:hypothetical protein|nr:hypothetical protein [Ideonella sp.]
MMLKFLRVEAKRHAKAASILRRPTGPLEFPAIEWPATRPPATRTADGASSKPVENPPSPNVDDPTVRAPTRPAPPPLEVLRQRRPPSPMDRVLSPHATRWLLSLPRRHRPRLLPIQFPHVANRLALVWREPGLAEACFADLMLDRRGGRIGFPRAVTEEILRLNELFMALQDARYRPLAIEPTTSPGGIDSQWPTTQRDAAL